MTLGQVVPCRATSDCLDAEQPTKGPRAMQSVFDILMLLLGVARTFIFIHFIMSWLISFEVLNVRQPFVGQVWYTLQRILEPIYGPIRRVLPDLGGIDLSPIVALLGIEVIRIVLINNIGLLY